MSQFTDRYYPTICIRRAEMKALEKLPLSEKAKMLPVVLLAPWLNSILFDNTIDTLKKSIGDLPFIVDLDIHYRSNSDLPSRKEFRRLLDPHQGSGPWIEFIKKNENYIPCVQFWGRTADDVEEQISEFRDLGRGYCFRIEPRTEADYERILQMIPSIENDDNLLIIDVGYSPDYLQLENDAAVKIERLVEVSPETPFVVSSSNFPNTFTEFDNMSALNIGSRRIYSDLLKKYGNYKLYYGDWASTKPRTYDGGGSRPLPRIDFPTKDRWIIARSKEESWDFEEAAKRITRLPEWLEHPKVWGAGMIEKTAAGLPGGISTGPQAIAARVNLHLYLQNNFAGQATGDLPSEPWVDPI